MAIGPPAGDSAINFEPYRLIPARRLLLRDETPVPLGSRATDILIALVSRAGELVTKDELFAAAWPDRTVDEVNLRAQIAAIRRALGDGQSGQRYLTTIPGRGYCFVAPLNASSAAAPAVSTASGTSKLPPRLTRPVGRTALIAALRAQLAHRRFLTLVGPAGIGKTTVALAIARELESSYADGAIFADLATVVDPDLVPGALAAALGFSISGTNQIQALIAFLKDKRGLLVLDSCEHVIDIAAIIAEEIHRRISGVHILATSREPLHSAGEHVHRMAPLEIPTGSDPISADKAMSYGSVELFVERAAAYLGNFELIDQDAPIVADICRRLDGIALAIEFAASHVDVFGLRELANHLDNRFRLLSSGRRTAPARHRTLQAALDWSYRLLPEAERSMLRRLAVFVGPFDLDGAGAVSGDYAIAILANLVSKSLVVADSSRNEAHYRLLNTTRIFALERLTEGGELNECRARHADYHRNLFARARGEWETAPTAAWIAAYSHRLADLRAALDWAFSPDGDPSLGIALTADAVPLWLQLSLNYECRQRAEMALARIDVPTADNARLRMRLSTARNLSLMYMMEPIAEVDAGWRETLAVSEQLADPDYQRRAIWGLFAASFNKANYRDALSFARRFHALADRPDERLIGDRLIGTALHLLGDQTTARHHIERMLAAYVRPPHSAHIIRYQNDQLVAGRRVLAPILWLLGCPEQAMNMIGEAINDAVALDQGMTLCNFLAQAACPVAVLAQDDALIDRYTTMLLEQSGRYSLDAWHAYGRCFDGIARIRRGDTRDGVSLLRNATDDLQRAGFTHNHTFHLGVLAEGLVRAGAIQPGLEAIETALSRINITAERWCLPELLRIKGELLLRGSSDDASAHAEEQFRDALRWAASQNALSWELRAATSLARLMHERGRGDEARSVLQTTYDRFSEGFETEDLKQARLLLDALS